MSRLLLLACSSRKRPDPGRLPAIERYDGPAYRVLRRFVRLQPGDAPDVYILSARFGLIRGDEPIPAYEQRMTPLRAEELRGATADHLRSLNIGRRYQNAFLHAGAIYREILFLPLIDELPQQRLTSPTGSQGVQLTRLKSWLYQEHELCLDAAPTIRNDTAPVRFTFKGIDYEMALAEVITVARRSLKNGTLKSLRATAWYVLVDGQQIPPKWLMSQLTGVPVSDFHSMEARHVLTQIGMSVRQV